jgi:hypothetical protein
MIPTKIHGILDYLMGLVLMASPWLLNFAAGGAETWVPVILGAAVIVYSLLTDYELGLVPLLSMRGHLWLDAAGGLLLATSPYLLGFNEHVLWPHLILGLAEIAASQLTAKVPTYGPHHRPVQTRVPGRAA